MKRAYKLLTTRIVIFCFLRSRAAAVSQCRHERQETDCRWRNMRIIDQINGKASATLANRMYIRFGKYTYRR